ncbi:UNVERIFIED_CONTAM: hypothetical protein Sangu_0376400 [Sesamum angustifolium]|uniref:DUF659 domain-containing protein n=1 Tax=Sesamum angustifolium TaxID=2727405 RepID=A0AAW2QT10_9LAMI
MAVNEGGTMFIRAVNCEGEYKDKWFISTLIKEVMVEVGVANVVQIITDNAPVCKAACLLVEQTYPHVFWTPCVVHTLNLALKNICAAKNTEQNGITYEECHWITEIAASALMIRNFIMNHSMRLAMFNEFSKLKLLVVTETHFASVIVMLKRFKLINQQLKMMVISEQWSCYRDDDVTKAINVKEKLFDESWWDSIDYILDFTEPIYEMLRATDTDKHCLHLVYDMWNNMISKVKKAIYKHEKKNDYEESSFSGVVHKVLEDRWSKSNTPLHCLAHSLNPRCSTKEWQSQHPNLTSLQSDVEISRMRKIYLKRLFPNDDTRREVNVELARFFGCLDDFADEDSLRDRWEMDPIKWWLVHGSATPHLQRDVFETIEDIGILEIANLSLDEPELESVLFDEITKDLKDDHDNLNSFG